MKNESLKLVLRGKIHSAKTRVKISSLAPACTVQMRCPAVLPRTFSVTNPMQMSLPSHSKVRLHNSPSTFAPRTTESALIYVVDDTEGLTLLYTLFLKGTGYRVRAFNHRTEALEALTADGITPDLLIMDYLGDSMPADRFMHRCLAAHPSLRILMASGLSEMDVRFSSVRPDRFNQKPFTAGEFLQEVRATLAA